jgi:FkbM family methyltransferase
LGARETFFIPPITEGEGHFLVSLASFLAVKPRLVPYPHWVYGVAIAVYWTPRASLIQKVRLRLLESAKAPFVIRWLHGIKLHVYPRDETCREIYLAGFVEPDEFLFLDRVLKPGMVVMDVGANLGIYTIFSAAKVGRSGLVVSIEPSSREYRRLQENCALNHYSNVTALKVGVSDHQGEARLQVARDDHAGHNTLGSFVYSNTLLETEEVIRVETLDAILRSQKLDHVDLIKMDIEGAEEKALLGAKYILKSIRPVILFECQELTLKLQGASPDRIQEYLRAFDYQLYAFGDAGKVIPLEAVSHPSIDLIAIPRGEESRWIS